MNNMVNHDQNGAPGQPKKEQDPPKNNLAGEKAKRKVRNFLLQPLLQVKLGMYCILLSIFFAIALAAIFYSSFAQLVDPILKLTDAEDEVRDIFVHYWKGARLWLYLSISVYLLATIGISVLYTHKLVGPTIAFRRHIRFLAEGRHDIRTYLRKGDAFVEVADELNNLSEVLERKDAKGVTTRP